MKDENASLEQWKILCILTQKLEAMKPWKQFEDMELFALKLSETEDIIYASIMGFHKMCYGLTFYIGETGFMDLSTIAYEISDHRYENYVTMESEFYSVYFDDQKNVSWQQTSIFKKLGLEPANYPHFVVKEKGCFPDDPDKNEVENYILYIAALTEAIEYFLKHEVIIDFKNEIFVYDVQNKSGTNEELLLLPREYMPIIADEMYLNSLNEIECNDQVWEMEYNYMNQGIEREDERISNLRCVMIADVMEGTMLSCVPLDVDSDENEVVLANLMEMIEKFGRPSRLCIANARLYPLIGPSCDELNIEIEVIDEFAVIDAFWADFCEFSNHSNMA